MNDLTDYLEGLDFTEPDAADAMVRAFSERLAHLIVAQGSSADDDVERALIDTFAAVIETYSRFDPSIDASILSWFYRQAIPHLPAPADRRLRKSLDLGLPALLAGKPHDLTEPEIANALNLREPVVARRIRDGQTATGASNASQDRTIDIQAVSAGVRERLVEAGRERQPDPNRVRIAWKEGGLALIAAGAVLALVFMFMRSDQSNVGVEIFRDEDEVLPDPITVDSPEVRLAPSGRSPYDDYFISVYPALSDDGRFVLFTSNQADLVPNDTNNGYDIFVRETATGTIHRVSLGPLGEELDGESFAGAISGDGSRVVFIHQQRFDGMEVYLSDWQAGTSRVISEVPNELSYAEYFAPGLSGDGRTAVFWGINPEMDERPCDTGGELSRCYDLYVYEDDTGALTHIPFGGPYLDFFQTTSLTFDGALIPMTVTEEDAIWKRLDTPNAQEAVLYDWRQDRIIQLNVSGGGTVGNGPSYNPVISTDGRTLAFVSEADNLVEGDDDSMADLFFLDRESGVLKRIGFSQEGDRVGLDPDQSPYFMGIDISPDGRYVIFPRFAPNSHVTDSESIYCSDFAGDWYCLATFLYDSELDAISQVSVSPILIHQTPDQTAQGILLFLPSISENAELISFQVGSWDVQPPCPAEGCSSIWLLHPDQNTAAIASRPEPGEQEDSNQETWIGRGSIPGPAGWVNAVAFSPDSRWIASGRRNGAVQLADLTGAEEPVILGTLGESVTSLAFSPDGRRLAVGCFDGSVTIWDVESGEVSSVLRDHPGLVLDVAFSPDGSSLAVGTNRALWVWTDSAAGFYQSEGYEQKDVNAVDFSPDGRLLASVSENEVRLRAVETGAVLLRLAAHREQILDVAFSPDSDNGYLLATTSRDRTAQIWRLSPGLNADHVISIEHASWVSSAAFSPNGGLLATGSFDSTVYLWDTTSFDLVGTLFRSPQDQILSVDFSPGGKLLAGGTVQGLRLWQSSAADISLPQASRFFRFSSSDPYEAEEVYLENWFRISGVDLKTYGSMPRALEAAGVGVRTLNPIPDTLTLQAVGVYKNLAGETVGVAQSFVFTSFYGPARLTFLQALLDFETDFKLSDWPIALSATIFEQAVDGQNAEVAIGGWSFEDIDGDQILRRWSDDASSIFIRWQDDEWYYSIYYDQPYTSGMFIGDDPRLDLDGLLELIETSWRDR